MKISICCVGKVTEKFFTDAIAEYSKRLSKYCTFEIIEVKDEKTKENASDTEINLVKEKEGKRILEKINPTSYVIALVINGKMYSSENFAKKIGELMNEGKSHITFVIGGSLGLCDEIIDKADMKLSFSQMTFPHQLMRVILSEQIYRAYRILNNEPYHK
ncbi:MAG: 23S rRNA (pseudouridine(1915)-N(3))-methyltransferase RlmH [Lachnospiraceae bacterium]|nr:23S rRNA (pseudouridine(1915)-N(3))-methyltransferase RlmH [Lachnospiraceae bacterium]MBO4462215.1 23S rRNA (pseudouridine(1915)-N(3))-methyltransferase RlmH [Lachnospiraceae bacterium]MBR5789521.1 23S rRNA (pseudouridine(1915)-N(3))-methyltransferase RlmH [Lachnospiraceae bacterium]